MSLVTLSWVQESEKSSNYKHSHKRKLTDCYSTFFWNSYENWLAHRLLFLLKGWSKRVTNQDITWLCNEALMDIPKLWGLRAFGWRNIHRLGRWCTLNSKGTGAQVLGILADLMLCTLSSSYSYSFVSLINSLKETSKQKCFPKFLSSYGKLLKLRGGL